MDDVAAKANALSNAKRLQILEWLKEPTRQFGPEHPNDEKEGVCGLYIAEKLGASPATASVHLKVLTQAGFLRPLRIANLPTSSASRRPLPNSRAIEPSDRRP